MQLTRRKTTRAPIPTDVFKQDPRYSASWNHCLMSCSCYNRTASVDINAMSAVTCFRRPAAATSVGWDSVPTVRIVGTESQPANVRARRAENESRRLYPGAPLQPHFRGQVEPLIGLESSHSQKSRASPIRKLTGSRRPRHMPTSRESTAFLSKTTWTFGPSSG